MRRLGGTRLLAVGCLAGAMLLVAACGATATTKTSGKATSTSSSKRTTRASTTAKASSAPVVTIFQTTPPSADFNPLITSSAYDSDITSLIYDDLLSLNAKLGYIPWMATYQIKDNGKQVLFHLKSGIKFQDGTPLTAQDVAATFNFVFKPNYPGPLQSNFAALKGAQAYLNALGKLQAEAAPPSGGGAAKLTHGQFETQAGALYQNWLKEGAIQVVNPQTVAFNLDSVYAPILDYVGLEGIEEAKQLDALKTPTLVANAAKAPMSLNPVGSGPFSFVKYQTGQYTQLKAFPGYWNGAPKIDQVIFRVGNQNEEVGLLQKGQVDAVGVNSSQINPQDSSLLAKIPSVRHWEYPQFGYQMMALNLNEKKFQDVRVRQAMMYAIDRKGIVDQLLQGHGTVVNAPFAPPSWAYPTNLAGKYPYDPAKAEALLTQAGWTKNSSGVLAKDGMTLAFTLIYPGGTSNPVRQQSAPLIQDNLDKVGMKVQTKALDFNTLVSDILNKPSQANAYDACLIGWSLSVEPDLTGLYGATDIYNLSRWGPSNIPASIYNQGMKLTQEGAATFSQAQRTKIYNQLAQLYSTNLPVLYLYSQNQQVFFNNRVQNVIQDARGPLTRTELWTVQPK